MALTAFGEQQVAELTPMAGWTFAYNVNADLVTTTLTGTGTVTGATGFAVLNTSAAIDSGAKIETKLPLRYIPGQGALARFTAIFTTGIVGSTQIIGVGDASDGLFFGYNGATFGVMRRNAGVDTWTTFTDWSNGINGGNAAWLNLLDWTKGNVFQIQFQWLGFGEIQFSIENPSSGGLVVVHRIRFANTSAVTSLQNPTLPVMAHVANTTNDSAIILKTPSAMGFCEGKIDNPTPPHPLSLPRTLTAAKATVSTQANILTLSSPASWLTKANRIRSQLGMLSVATDGTKTAIVRIVKDTTLGGAPSYTAYSANTSPIEYDTAGTTLTGGSVVFAATLDKVDSQVFDLRQWALFLNPGEKLTVSVTSASATDVNVAINWTDLL
jgi:hypothetical protein